MRSAYNPDGTLKVDGPELNAITHKLSHALLGGVVGGVRGDAVAGAIGGVASETIAEMIQEDPAVVKARVDAKAEEQGVMPGSAKYEELKQAEIRSTINWARMGTAVASLAAGCDVDIADTIATTALEHNFTPTLLSQLMREDLGLDDEEVDLFLDPVEELYAETFGLLTAPGEEDYAEDDSGYFDSGDEKDTPLNNIGEFFEEKAKDLGKAIEKTPCGKKVLDWGRVRLKHTAEQQAPLNASYAEYEQQCSVEFERVNGVRVDTLPKSQQAVIRNGWLEDYSNLSLTGGIGGIGGVIDDGFKYAGHQKGKNTARSLRQMGVPKPIAQDIGRVEEGVMRAVGMLFNPAPIGKVGQVTKVASTAGKASQAVGKDIVRSIGSIGKPLTGAEYLDLATQGREVSSLGRAVNRNRQSIKTLYLKHQRVAANSNTLRMRKTGTAEATPASFVASSSNGVVSTERVTSGSSVSSTTSRVTKTGGGTQPQQAANEVKLKVQRNRQGRAKGVTHVQDHHIISNKKAELKKHPIWERAGMNPDVYPNKMLLPTTKGASSSTTTRSIHQGRHKESVHKRLLKKMDREIRLGEREGWSQSQYQEALREIIRAERQVLKSGNRILNKNHRPGAKDPD